MRLIVALLLALALLGGHSPVQAVELPGPSPADWRALASEANTSLSSAIADAARGRPATSRLRSAVAVFDRLLDQAPLSDRDRARVYYNRGVAQLELGDAGAAVLDLRRSDELAPGVAATIRELTSARERVHKGETPSTSTQSGSAALNTLASQPAHLTVSDLAGQTWKAIRRVDIGGGSRLVLSMGAAALAFLLLTVRLFTLSAARRWLTIVSCLFLVIAAGSVITIVIDERLRTSDQDVVVTAAACSPRQGPDAIAYPPAKLGGRDALGRGTELTVVEARPDPEQPAAIAWLKVRERAAEGMPASSSTVWVSTSDVAWVRPSAR